eukprot:gnl/TRDRNA2_/TRDRNA2_32823_c1_seq1.p1 gnl/TRDRNA2_/TRDRNA2_32823_c1~~gnl/TRDRNA2_/TRDRNA2_32823_c1_seq1.p1  ORF type:complete len:281 (+),score=30.95 gnl/TRDRNA2_/TRDRNA2_32823_c1_seq1:74-916(+)
MSSAHRANNAMFHKTSLCNFYPRGICTRGENCAFAHHPDELRPLPDFSRTRICPSMVKTGSCSISGCRFAHNKDELQPSFEKRCPQKMSSELESWNESPQKQMPAHYPGQSRNISAQSEGFYEHQQQVKMTGLPSSGESVLVTNSAGANKIWLPVLSAVGPSVATTSTVREAQDAHPRHPDGTSAPVGHIVPEKDTCLTGSAPVLGCGKEPSCHAFQYALDLGVCQMQSDPSSFFDATSMLGSTNNAQCFDGNNSCKEILRECLKGYPLPHVTASSSTAS